MTCENIAEAFSTLIGELSYGITYASIFKFKEVFRVSLDEILKRGLFCLSFFGRHDQRVPN